MKKFFSFFAALLFAGSMMAQVTILPTDFTPAEASDYSVTKDGVTVAVTASTVTSEQMRIFKNQSITISAESNISSIEFTCTANGTAKYGPGCFNAQDGYTFEAAGKKGTWTGSATSVTFTAESNQVRATQIVVTLGGEVPPTPSINYYVAGSMNGWAADAAYMLTPNNENLYQGEFTFAANDEFKVIGFDGETTTWFPEGMGNNFQITEAGDYKITFNPAGNVEGWHGGFFNVVMKEAPAAISCLEVYQLAKDDVVGLLNPVTVTYSNGANVWVMDGSASMLIYLPSGFTNNFQAGDVLSGVAGTVDIYQNIVYEVKPDATQAAAIVATPGEAPAPSQAAVIEASDVNKYVILPGFSIEGAFTADSKTSLSAVLGDNTVTIYNNFKFAYTFEAGKTYDIIGVVSAYKGNPQVYFISAEEAGGEVPPTPSINYYVAGSMNGWAADAAYMLTPNNENLYQGEFTFAANDEFKVIGFDGETTTWFPEGMGNNFQITEAGDYKITFNPAGNVEGWYEGFFNVVKKEAPIVHQYEVAEAIAAGLQENDEVLVRGIITKMEFKGANFAKFGSVNIYVADVNGAEGEFEFFNCYSLNADTFRTSIPNYDPTDKTWAQFNEVADENGNTIHVGDTVIAFGKYKLYNSTHELNTGCYLVDIKHAAETPVDTIKLDFNTENTTYAFVDNQYFSEYGSTDIYLSDINVNTSTHAFEGDGNYLVLDFYPENPNNVTGVYQALDETLDLEYTYMLTINGTDTAVVEFADGAIQVEIGEVNKELGMAQLALAGQLISTEGDIYAITALVIAYYDFLPEEGVEDVVIDPKAIKRLVNGQVVIEKAGKTYNMNGAVIR